MNPNHLSPRLEAIARLIKPGSKPVDVGTDHAYLPAWLLSQGIVSHCTATDIRPGPLDAARRTLEQAGVLDSTELLLCDGLSGCLPDQVDTVIIAGMGGDTIAGILEAAPWTRDDRRLFLQPMSKGDHLRRWLFENGYRICAEHIVKDAGRLYSILSVSGEAESEPMSEAEYYTGRFSLIENEILAPELLEQMIAKFTRSVSGMSQSAAAAGQRQLQMRILEQLQGFRRRISP